MKSNGTGGGNTITGLNFEKEYDIDKEFIKKSDTFSKEEVQKLIDKNNENSKTLNCLKTKEYFSIKCFDDLSK